MPLHISPITRANNEVKNSIVLGEEIKKKYMPKLKFHTVTIYVPKGNENSFFSDTPILLLLNVECMSSVNAA